MTVARVFEHVARPGHEPVRGALAAAGRSKAPPKVGPGASRRPSAVRPSARLQYGAAVNWRDSAARGFIAGGAGAPGVAGHALVREEPSPVRRRPGARGARRRELAPGPAPRRRFPTRFWDDEHQGGGTVNRQAGPHPFGGSGSFASSFPCLAPDRRGWGTPQVGTPILGRITNWRANQRPATSRNARESFMAPWVGAAGTPRGSGFLAESDGREHPREPLPDLRGDRRERGVLRRDRLHRIHRDHDGLPVSPSHTTTLHGSITPRSSCCVSAWCASFGLHAPRIW